MSAKMEPQGMQEIIDTGLKKADIGHVEGILSEMIFLPKSISKWNWSWEKEMILKDKTMR